MGAAWRLRTVRGETLSSTCPNQASDCVSAYMRAPALPVGGGGEGGAPRMCVRGASTESDVFGPTSASDVLWDSAVFFVVSDRLPL